MSSEPHPSSAESRQSFEGTLNKFTNVVKGWQYRRFVLDPESGHIEYYLLEDRNGKSRGSQHLAGTVVIPSDEDSQTFVVNFATGESYKLRAQNVRERQIWVDRIRAVAQMHDNAVAKNNPPLPIREHMPPTPPGSRSHISNGEPSDALQHLSLSVLDAFGSVHDILHQTELKHDELARSIESHPRRLDEDLLIMKATSQAALICMENALTILQDQRELRQGPITTTVQETVVKAAPMSMSPKKSTQFFMPSPTKPRLPHTPLKDMDSVNSLGSVASLPAGCGGSLAPPSPEPGSRSSVKSAS